MPLLLKDCVQFPGNTAMYLRPTPPLSEEASKEILAELEHPVKDTPALKKQKERQVLAAALSEKAKAKAKAKKQPITA